MKSLAFSGILFVLFVIVTSEQNGMCGGEKCRPVKVRGIDVPQFCGQEKRCEPCSTHVCSLSVIPIPCQAFCSTRPEKSHEVSENGADPKNLTFQEPRGDSGGQPEQCNGQHGSVVVAFLGVALVVSVVFNILQWHPDSRKWLSCAGRERLYHLTNVQGEGAKILRQFGSQIIVQVPEGQMLVARPENGSQDIWKCSSESLRHIRTQPEDERNGALC